MRYAGSQHRLERFIGKVEALGTDGALHLVPGALIADLRQQLMSFPGELLRNAVGAFDHVVGAHGVQEAGLLHHLDVVGNFALLEPFQVLWAQRGVKSGNASTLMSIFRIRSQSRFTLPPRLGEICISQICLLSHINPVADRGSA